MLSSHWDPLHYGLKGGPVPSRIFSVFKGSIWSSIRLLTKQKKIHFLSLQNSRVGLENRLRAKSCTSTLFNVWNRIWTPQLLVYLRPQCYAVSLCGCTAPQCSGQCSQRLANICPTHSQPGIHAMAIQNYILPSSLSKVVANTPVSFQNTKRKV